MSSFVDKGCRRELEDVRVPCPTCGLSAGVESFESDRPDGRYLVTLYRCPNALTTTRPKPGRPPKPKPGRHPIFRTEERLDDMPKLAQTERDALRSEKKRKQIPSQAIAIQVGTSKNSIDAILSGASASTERLEAIRDAIKFHPEPSSDHSVEPNKEIPPPVFSEQAAPAPEVPVQPEPEQIPTPSPLPNLPTMEELDALIPPIDVQLRQAADELRHRVLELEQDNAKLTHSLDELRQAWDEVNEEAAQGQVMLLGKVFLADDEAVYGGSGIVGQLRAERDALQVDNDQLVDQVNNLTEALADAKKTFLSEIEQLTQQKAELERQIESLQVTADQVAQLDGRPVDQVVIDIVARHDEQIQRATYQLRSKVEMLTAENEQLTQQLARANERLQATHQAPAYVTEGQATDGTFPPPARPAPELSSVDFQDLEPEALAELAIRSLDQLSSDKREIIMDIVAARDVERDHRRKLQHRFERDSVVAAASR